MGNDYEEMLDIQRTRQAEIAAWRLTQDLDEVRDLEISSINRVRVEAKPVIPPLSEPIEDEDTEAKVITSSVEVQAEVAPKPKSKPDKPVS